MPMLSLLLALLLGDELAEQKKALFDAISNYNDTKGIAAVKKVASFDSKEAIDVLLAACAAMERTSAPLEKEREVCLRVMETHVYDPETRKWKGDKEKYYEAKGRYEDLSAKLARLQAITNVVIQGLGGLKSEPSIRELIARLQSSSDVFVRVAVASALGRAVHPDIRPALLAQLKKEKDAGVRVALIDALRIQHADEAAELLCGALQDEYWQVRVAAAQALGALKIVTAVEFLIEAIRNAEGRVRTEMNAALVAITGVDKHGDGSAWRSWWEKNREALLAGTYRPDPAERAGETGGTTFYGIPVTSTRVVFVIDRSGSMAGPAKWKPDDVATGGGPDVPKSQGERKIDVARYELKKVLAMMPDGAQVNILFFGSLVEPMGEKLATLNKEMRRRANVFVDSVEPGTATNISEGLLQALAFAGLADKLVKGGIDTIYLLSDGMPTAGIRNAEELLTAIAASNRTRKVAIHAIGIEASVESEKLLKRLAGQNGGTYVRR